MHPRRLVVGARWPPVPRSNEAVHHGEMDLRDDVETASQLFVLVNAIADQMITQPKLRDWLEEFDARLFDEKIERDATAGKLDKLADEARANLKAGRGEEF